MSADVISGHDASGAEHVRLRHMRLHVALHTLAAGNAGSTPLLLLHGLGERTPVRAPQFTEPWRGPVYGLDFTGHGDSDIAIGGGYTSEALIGDVDIALAHVGQAVVVGRGLGAYVALLTAAARPDHIAGLVLADGPGLAGGGPTPGSLHVLANPQRATSTPDPLAMAELSREIRPPELATAFVAEVAGARHLTGRIVVSARSLPPWLDAVAAHPDVRRVPLQPALAELAELADTHDGQP